MNLNTPLVRTVLASLIIVLIFTASSFTTQGDEDEEEGWEELFELTGTLNYILLGLSILILPWRYIYKGFMKKMDLKSNFRDKFRSSNSLMKNLHYFIGVSAVLMITYHAYLVISELNLALISGLGLIWLYLITGIMPSFDKIPSAVKKWTYTIHRNEIYLVITVGLLYLGHILAD